MSARAWAAAGLAALTVAGCGARPSDGAREQALAWLGDIHAERYEAACERMLPLAATGLRARFFPDVEGCAALVRAYREAMSDEKLDALHAEGLRAQPPIREDRIGIFPRARRHEFEVLLMERTGDDWKVVSVGIAPDRPR